MSKTPSEIWAMSSEDRRFVFQGIKYDHEQKARQRNQGGSIADAQKN